MKKGFVVSAVLYPLLVLAIAFILGVIAMSDNRRKVLENMKLEVSEESETDPEMSNSALYYKMQALEEAYAEMSSRLSEDRLEELQNETISRTFPIGSIFISTTNNNPSNYMGGTWVAYGQGRTLIGVGTGTDSNSITESFSAESTGGEYKHQLTETEMPIHTHTQNPHQHSLTSGTATYVTITGGMRVLGWAGSATNASVSGIVSVSSNNVKDRTASSGSNFGSQTNYINASHSHPLSGSSTLQTATNNNSGGSQFHNIIQPYITVYFWKRTG